RPHQESADGLEMVVGICCPKGRPHRSCLEAHPPFQSLLMPHHSRPRGPHGVPVINFRPQLQPFQRRRWAEFVQGRRAQTAPCPRPPNHGGLIGSNHHFQEDRRPRHWPASPFPFCARL